MEPQVHKCPRCSASFQDVNLLSDHMDGCSLSESLQNLSTKDWEQLPETITINGSLTKTCKSPKRANDSPVTKEKWTNPRAHCLQLRENLANDNQKGKSIEPYTASKYYLVPEDNIYEHFWVFSFNCQEGVVLGGYYGQLKERLTGYPGWFDVGNSSYALWHQSNLYATVGQQLLGILLGLRETRNITYVSLICATPRPVNHSAHLVGDLNAFFGPGNIQHTENEPNVH